MSRTDATRMTELMTDDRVSLNALLDATIVGTVAFIHADGTPGVMPTAVVRWGDRLVVHGSTGSRWMRLVSGGPVAISVTAVDGVIVARSAFESSLAYRSAVLFGTLQLLAEDEKETALDALTERLIPGRTSEVRASSAKEIAATLVLAMPIDQWSLRVSAGWPDDEHDDVAGPAWAGQVRFGPRPITISRAPGLRDDIMTPPSVNRLPAAH